MVVTGAVVALAVIAGGAYVALGGDHDGDGSSTDNSAVSAGTRGYVLVAPDAVDAYTKSRSGPAPGEPNAQQKKEADALGVKNARAVSAVYNAPGTDPADPSKTGGRRLVFDGLYGEITDPAAAVDRYLAGVGDKGPKGDGKRPGIEMRRVGQARVVKPVGFEGALMKCQDVQVVHAKDAAASKSADADYRIPVCAWSDYSTVGGANVLQLAQVKTGGPGATQDEAAALTATLYLAARRKA
ncbi:hypothetical protein ABZY31_26175 [Streptomyces sp. NPDC006529]|uniref:hypothetical protein n=1 Tax=Streptomyces sp. NPDC006529 TaxID=3157177 RepID=UPI0033BBEA51